MLEIFGHGESHHLPDLQACGLRNQKGLLDPRKSAFGMWISTTCPHS